MSPLLRAVHLAETPEWKRAASGGGGSWGNAVIALVSLASIAIIGILDRATGTELRSYPLYVAPVALVSWKVGLRTGILASVFAVAVWVGSSHLAGLTLTPLVWAVNAAAHLVAFGTVVVLVAHLQRSRSAEQRLARIDSLTGLLNSRAFDETATAELDRQRRYGHPVTIAYLDLDSFKEVNDRFGHREGDALLQKVALALRSATRATDAPARLGGDEFALLLPETDLEGARRLLGRVQSGIASAMSERAWEVTCSIGAVTFDEPPPSVDTIVNLADRLMYEVKRSSKNAIRIERYPGEGAPTEPAQGDAEDGEPAPNGL